MVVDTSALIAVLLGEPETASFSETFDRLSAYHAHQFPPLRRPSPYSDFPPGRRPLWPLRAGGRKLEVGNCRGRSRRRRKSADSK